MLAIEAKKHFWTNPAAPNQQEWIVFSKGDDNQSPKAQISDGEAAVMFTDALSVKLRGSHAA